ncbi:Uncharacterised protein [Amycolatopsis camponoti]|uniref:Uncharacterized protein n=1 Tax=Amycolatopsis camponoti TaxID=2606593 RepID=A0A6I8LII7_9PSEU|nr:Uncharacterised protein [Amycolatopsis camponoti]
MAEVHPGHVHAGIHQGPHLLRRGSGRTQGTNDLRASAHVRTA